MKSSETLSVAILRTDEVMPEYRDRHDDYPAMFIDLLERAAVLRPRPLELRTRSFDARVGDYPGAAEFDACLITGSRKSVYDDEDWIRALAGFCRSVLAAERKIIGICFGHQLIAHFFGGETGPAQAGWGVGVQRNRAVTREPWMEPADPRLNLLASHRDQVIKLPPGARVIATSEFCPVGGFVMDDRVLTFQGHPEFQKSYSEDLMHRRRELLGDDTFDAGIESLELETDELKAGQWMLNFIEYREAST